MNCVDLDVEITALEAMSLDDLRRAWLGWTKTTPPRVSAGLLRLALAHHIQSLVSGGVSKALERRLREIAEGHNPSAPRPGTRLVREWRGKVHVVTVTDGRGFHWQDREWGSLSEIARTITGTRWSGPAFFGTRRQQKRAA